MHGSDLRPRPSMLGCCGSAAVLAAITGMIEWLRETQDVRACLILEYPFVSCELAKTTKHRASGSSGDVMALH